MRVTHFTISVADLLGRPGAYRDVSVSAPLGDVGTALARLDGPPVRLQGRLESVVEGILVTGAVTAPVALQCARCLASVRSEVVAEVCEVFFAPGHDEAAEDDSYRVTGDEIDAEALARDAIALALPLAPLCREECRGLCPNCGRDLNDGPCDCRFEETDPRWAPLEALRERLER
jgi:uncharacterized protein